MQIHELPASTSVASTDVFVKETSVGVTQKITWENIGAAQAMPRYTGNIDDLRNIGIYYITGATGTGAGPNNFWGMLVVAGNGDRAVQLYIDVWGDYAQFRRYTGSWSAWKGFTLTA